ncbi:MAG: NAD(P)-dependent oxidoreductase [Pseudomonadota bacterium]
MKFFPMFLRMAGRRAVVVGGGEQAAQKVRLLLKTEVAIDLVARDPEPELQDLAESGRISIHRDVSAEIFRDTALVFIGSGCPGADAAWHGIAKDTGALVNVVDQPHLCDATTPSIVDRDPVVVAIGTEGTAPVLGRIIKTRIEESLEPRLGDLAALAGRLRDAVAFRVARPKRRAFWRWVFSGTPRQIHARGGQAHAAQTIKAAIAAGGAPETQTEGLISVIGAGLGDADLLTLRAVQRLQEADAIFVEPGVSPDVLELARRDAERIMLATSDLDRSGSRTFGIIRAARYARAVWLTRGDAQSHRALADRACTDPNLELVPGVPSTPAELALSA